MRNSAKLTSPHTASTLSTGRVLPHSGDLGVVSDTGRAGGLVPHPALERDRDENPGTILGKTALYTPKVANVVVRPPDAQSQGSNLNVDNDNVAKTKLSKTSKWDRRRVKRAIQRLQNYGERNEISKCILENFQQELLSAKEILESSSPPTSKPNELQQTAVERSEQAALLSCQVSEGGMFWGGQDPSMVQSDNIPLPPNWKPTLAS